MMRTVQSVLCAQFGGRPVSGRTVVVQVNFQSGGGDESSFRVVKKYMHYGVQATNQHAPSVRC